MGVARMFATGDQLHCGCIAAMITFLGINFLLPTVCSMGQFRTTVSQQEN